MNSLLVSVILTAASAPLIGSVGATNHSANTDLLVSELERPDGYKFTCEASEYYTEFVTKLSYWGAFFDSWSPDFIDYFTSTYERPFYYNRFQIVDGEISYERSDFWWPDYTPDRGYPERYYAATLENILDFVHYLANTYKSFIPNIDMIILGSEYYYQNPSWFTTDYPVFRFESTNEDWSILQWLLPTREYVQFWNMWGWSHVYDLIVEKTSEDDHDAEGAQTERLTERAKMPWSDRIDMAIFRGSVYLTTQIRYKMVETLIDHGYGKNGTDATKFFDVKVEYALAQDPMLMANRDALFMSSEDKMDDLDQMKYKFVIVADGSCSADRVARQLLYGSVMFKQESRYKSQYFYDLVPYQHYIPWTDAQDLYSKVTYYLSVLTDLSDENKPLRNRLVRYMSYVALNGMKYVLQHFTSEYMDCQAINMMHLYVNTFKKTKIDKITLDNKIVFNKDNNQRFLDNQMNKTIVLDEEMKQRHRFFWPMRTVDPKVIQEIDDLMEEFDVSADDRNEFNVDEKRNHTIKESFNYNVSERNEVKLVMEMNDVNGLETWQLNTPFLLACAAFSLVFIAVGVVWKSEGFDALKKWFVSKYHEYGL